jgi:hypothetical protein
VEHHISEEEDSWFPTVREELGRKDLQEIGAEMIRLRDQPPARTKQSTGAGQPDGSRASLKAPKNVVAALSAGDPGLGGSMTELRDERTDDAELPGRATGRRMPGNRKPSAMATRAG